MTENLYFIRETLSLFFVMELAQEQGQFKVEAEDAATGGAAKTGKTEKKQILPLHGGN